VTIAAALTAHALNVGYTPVISPGVAALTRGRISHVDQNYLRAETYAAANGPLIGAQADIGLAQAWGGGLVATLDRIRFVVPVRSVDARPNPKYFGRRRGATWLNLLNEQAVGLAAMGSLRRAGDSTAFAECVSLRFSRSFEPGVEEFRGDQPSKSS
jgi:hypothetical protein